jgi:hypothetical protein
MCDSLPLKGGGRGFSNFYVEETPPCHYSTNRAPPKGGNLKTIKKGR